MLLSESVSSGTIGWLLYSLNTLMGCDRVAAADPDSKIQYVSFTGR